MQDFNSSINQSIKQKFVEREVYCCLTDMVEQLISSEKFDIYEYIDYYGTLPNGDEYTERERDERLEELRNQMEDTEQMDANDVAEIEAKIAELESMDFDQLPKIFEWWSVSDWLGEKLKAIGEVVVDEYATTLWGRQTTGQAILLDLCISKVCNEMEILEGQKNDWSK